ncbi:hypothetical protein [Dongia sedimenti]|uniref:Uncharacterized protein n=1 Tax=Dongia sedimenti TaxID=3064282 RepID=A0ABU0YK51_9PROT|nr:hypothetical protein [Rhodospirillaceae bacterium R-7]
MIFGRTAFNPHQAPDKPHRAEEFDRLADEWAATAKDFLLSDDDPSILEALATKQHGPR